MQKILITTITLTLLFITNISDGFSQNYSSYQDQSFIRQKKNSKPTANKNHEIALIFYKLSSILPDFITMAKDYKDYKASFGESKIATLNTRAEELKNAYSLLTLQEPLVVEMPVKLSEYSKNNKGFFITNFEEKTFFKFKHHNKNFAVVPESIMDQQWLKVTDKKTVYEMNKANKAQGGNSLTALIFMAPIYTDSSSTADIQGTDYWLTFAEINKIEVYLPNSLIPIWRSDDTTLNQENNRKLNELLKLRN